MSTRPVTTTHAIPSRTAVCLDSYVRRTVVPLSSVRLYALGSTSSFIRSVACRYSLRTWSLGAPAA